MQNIVLSDACQISFSGPKKVEVVLATLIHVKRDFCEFGLLLELEK